MTFISSEQGKDKFRNLQYRCTKCKAPVKTNSSSKSNLTLHFKRQHPARLKAFEKLLDTNKNYNQERKRNVEDSHQPSVLQFLQKEGQPKKVTQAVVDDKVFKFIISSSQAFTLVRDDSFKDLIQTLQPGRTLMTYQAFKAKLQDKFSSMQGKVKSELEEANHICITADIWSDARRSFLGMTAHTLVVEDDCMKRRSYALACKRIKWTHSYDVIARALMDLLESYNIQYKKAGIITENGSNFCKAFKMFSPDQASGEGGSSSFATSHDDNDEDEEELEFVDLSTILDQPSGDQDLFLPPHFRCAAHTLSLVATKDSEAALKPSTSEYTKLF